MSYMCVHIYSRWSSDRLSGQRRSNDSIAGVIFIRFEFRAAEETVRQTSAYHVKFNLADFSIRTKF